MNTEQVTEATDAIKAPLIYREGGEYFLGGDGSFIPPKDVVRDHARLVSELESVKAEKEKLREALEFSRTALNDWLQTYASDCCDPANVKEAIQRIRENHGTLAYIAQTQQRNDEALADKEEK